MTHQEGSATSRSLILLPLIALAAWGQPFTHQTSNRVTMNINAGWLFAPSDVANGQSVSLSESAFQPVCLPHTTKVVKHQNVAESDYRIFSWYRKHLTIPATYSGRRVVIEFQGVGTVAQVYVNGQLVGQHQGAYTPFAFDITSKVTAGSDNVIAVRVDSREHPELPPEGGSIDYLLFGGIVRDVNLAITDPVHVDWVFVSAPTVSQSSATVNARTRVVNRSATQKSCTVVTSIVDAAGVVAAMATATQNIPADSAYEFNYITSAISNPKLWHPDSPNLYTVFTQVKDGPSFVDEHQERTGIRSILFNKTDGKFYINGQALKIFGLNRHETYPFIGRAAANRVQAKDADIIKFDMGSNLVRCSHYPQDPEFLSRCDEIGLMAIEEVPGWQFTGTTAWQTVLKTNLDEMVLRDRNHPAVVSWGVRVNEGEDNHALYAPMNQRARQLDPTRPTYGHRIGVEYGGGESEFLEDIFSISDYSDGIVDPVAPRMPHLAGEIVGWIHPIHSWDPESVLVNISMLHAYIQNESFRKTNVLGALGWCAFDYNSNLFTAEEGNCYHGAADIYRIPKQVGYFYKSQANPAVYGPMVYLANYWTSSASRTVTVFTNCEEVELFVNGVSKGVQRPSVYTSLPHPVVQFANVTYQAGELKAVGKIGGSTVATHIRKTPGPGVKLVLTPDAKELVVGGDMTRVIVTVVDTAGQTVPRASNSVTLMATGVGTFLGESPISLEDGKAAFFVQTKDGQTGTIACSATGTGLTAGSASIAVVASQSTVLRQNPVVGSVRMRSVASVTRIAVGGRHSLPGLLTEDGLRVAVYSTSGRLIRQDAARNSLGGSERPKTAEGIVIVRTAPMR